MFGELSQWFNVFEDFICCDLCELVVEGKLQWVYGGVLLVFVVIVLIEMCKSVQIVFKQVVVCVVVVLIQLGQVVIVDGGIIIVVMIGFLFVDFSCMVVIYSLGIVVVLVDYL